MPYKPTIEFTNKNLVAFASLSRGDTFLWNNTLYQKGRFSNNKHEYVVSGAWDIKNGDQVYFNDSDLVEPRNITIRVL